VHQDFGLADEIHAFPCIRTCVTARAMAPFPATLFAGMHTNSSSALAAAEGFEELGDGSGAGALTGFKNLLMDPLLQWVVQPAPLLPLRWRSKVPLL
jgi:hypothetical protein